MTEVRFYAEDNNKVEVVRQITEALCIGFLHGVVGVAPHEKLEHMASLIRRALHDQDIATVYQLPKEEPIFARYQVNFADGSGVVFSVMLNQSGAPTTVRGVLLPKKSAA